MKRKKMAVIRAAAAVMSLMLTVQSPVSLLAVNESQFETGVSETTEAAEDTEVVESTETEIVEETAGTEETTEETARTEESTQETAESGEETEPAAYNLARVSGAVWDAQIGETSQVQDAKVAAIWENGVAPTSLHKVYPDPTTNAKEMRLAVENVDGVPAIHCNSKNQTDRVGLIHDTPPIMVDYSKDYKITAWVKAENVNATQGVYMRAQVGNSMNKNLGDGPKIKNNTDGWVLYEVPLTNLADTAGDDSGKMKFEIYFEKIAGDIWVKDLAIVQVYKYGLSQTAAEMNVGETLDLTVETDVPDVEPANVIWTSSDEAVATVENGKVTALKSGSTTIKAQCGDYTAECQISVSVGVGDVVWDARIGETSQVTNAANAPLWKDGMAPTSLHLVWKRVEPKGTWLMSVEQDENGVPMIHCNSQDADAIIAPRSELSDIDYSKSYKITAWVKADSLVGTGFYMRAQGGAEMKKDLAVGDKITGSTEGWVKYEVPLSDLEAKAGDTSGKMKIELFFEKMTGDVYVKDIALERDYKYELSQTMAKMNVGEKLNLTVDTDVPDVDTANVIWTSSDEAVATVENGMVTALKEGNTVIKAQCGDHTAECQISVFAKASGVVWSAEIGLTSKVPAANVAKWWKDGMAPTSLHSAWVAAVPADGKWLMSVEPDEDGVSAIHCSSQDESGRIGLSNTSIKVDYSKNYKISAWVKTENVVGNGLYMRAQVGENMNKNLGDGPKVKGSTEGWVKYEIPLRNLAATAGDNSGNMKFELFFQWMAGDVWVKDLVIVQEYNYELSQTTAEMNVGDTLDLTVTTDDPNVGGDMSKAVWTSSNPAVASVENGKVTALKGGSTTITAQIGENTAECLVFVNDLTVAEAYKIMRGKWEERLTGNSYWSGESTSEEYKNVIKANDEEAAAILEKFVGGSDTQLFSDLDLVLKEGSTSTDDDASVDLATATQRMQKLACVYRTKGSAYYQNADLKNKIFYALEWIYDHIYNENLGVDNRYGNWYHWWISMPQALGSTAILMYDELKAEKPVLLNNMAKTMEHFNEDPRWVHVTKGSGGGLKEMTGSNLADTSLVGIFRSMVAEDQQGVTLATGYFDEIVVLVKSGEGIYGDGSYIQHTNLAYTGGYGSVQLDRTGKMSYLTVGTPWEIAPEKSDVIYNWIMDGIRPLYAEGAVFEMVNGRSIARPVRSTLTTGREIMARMVLMVDSAPEAMQGAMKSFLKKQLIAGVEAMGTDYYEGMDAAAMMASVEILKDDSIIAEGTAPYARVFNGMDKAVAHGADFSMGLSYSSIRTGRFELGNHENLKGWHHADGMMHIYNGDAKQYADNYWNTVDPHRLPGITTDHSEWPTKDWGNYTGNGYFNGGTELERYAAVAMDFKNYSTSDNPNLAAKKAWFVFDDEIVCLGMDITGIDPARQTETIVENKKVERANKLLINGTAYATENKESTEQNVSWAWMEGNAGKDQMGYYFPDTDDVFVKREARTGSWKEINDGASISADPVTRNYISLALQHGANSKADGAEGYKYVILPGKSAQDVESYAKNPDIEILANDAFVQAALDKKENVSSYIFWPNGSELHRAGDLEADHAVVIMKKDKRNNRITLAISDPTQTNNTVTVRLYGNELNLEESDANITVAEQGADSVTLNVNVKGALGATFHATFSYVAGVEDVVENIDAIEEEVKNNMALTIEDTEKIQALVSLKEELEAINLDILGEEDQKRVHGLIEEIETMLANVDAAKAVMAGLADVTEVTAENAGEIQKAVDAYDNLTDAQKALLTDANRAQAEKVRALLQNYKDSIQEPGDNNGGNLIKDAEIAPGAPDTVLNNSKKELLGSNILTQEEKQAVEAGATARIWIAIAPLDVNTIAKETVDKIESKAKEVVGKNAPITYFDISLWKQVAGFEKGKVAEPGMNISLSMIIPENLRNKDASKKRTYYVLKEHNGVISLIEGTFNADTHEFRFETDSFSTYAIVYKDEDVVNNGGGNNYTPSVDGNVNFNAKSPLTSTYGEAAAVGAAVAAGAVTGATTITAAVEEVIFAGGFQSTMILALILMAVVGAYMTFVLYVKKRR